MATGYPLSLWIPFLTLPNVPLPMVFLINNQKYPNTYPLS